jgi:pyruvate dehydrogenase E1 component alpha subunit
MHISKCLAEVSIFGKAKAFNLSSVQVDGNNVTEIYRVAGDAIRDARNGLGPVLIECLTYRWLGHVGFHDDINKGLRSKEELNYWMRRCPIKILEDMLLGEGLLSEEAKRAILKKIEQELAEALLFAQESPFPQIRNFDTELYKNSISSLNEENL